MDRVYVRRLGNGVTIYVGLNKTGLRALRRRVYGVGKVIKGTWRGEVEEVNEVG